MSDEVVVVNSNQLTVEEFKGILASIAFTELQGDPPELRFTAPPGTHFTVTEPMTFAEFNAKAEAARIGFNPAGASPLSEKGYDIDSIRGVNEPQEKPNNEQSAA